MATGDPTGTDLCVGTTNGNTLPLASAPNFEQREITLGVGTIITSGTKYTIIIRALSGNSNNTVVWGAGTQIGASEQPIVCLLSVTVAS